MALKADADGFLIGDPLDMGAALDLWRDVRDDTRAILGMLRKRQGDTDAPIDTSDMPRGRNPERAAVAPAGRSESNTDTSPIYVPTVSAGLPAVKVTTELEIAPATDTPRRPIGAGMGSESTDRMLGRLISRVDWHEQRMSKGLRAILRAVEDLTDMMRQSGVRGGEGGGGGLLSTLGAALGGWFMRGGRGGGGRGGWFKKLLGKLSLGKIGGPLGVLLGGAGLASAWGEAEADETLTDRERASAKGTAVGEFGGLLAGGTAGAALGSFLGPIGTIAGGLIGGVLGAWGGGEAGKTVTETVIDFSDTETGMQIAQQWTATTAALRGRWDGLVARGAEVFSGLGAKWDALIASGSEVFSSLSAKWDTAVAQVQNWAADASGALSGFAEQSNTWIKDKTGVDVKATTEQAVEATKAGARSVIESVSARAEQVNAWVEEQTGVDIKTTVANGVESAKAGAKVAGEAVADSAAQANIWVEDKTGVNVGESVKRGVDATTDAVRSGFDRLLNLVRPSSAAAGSESASIEIDDAKLTADLSAGGVLRHTSTAGTTSGAVSDVPTLSQATEVSALAVRRAGAITTESTPPDIAVDASPALPGQDAADDIRFETDRVERPMRAGSDPNGIDPVPVGAALGDQTGAASMSSAVVSNQSADPVLVSSPEPTTATASFKAGESAHPPATVAQDVALIAFAGESALGAIERAGKAAISAWESLKRRMEAWVPWAAEQGDSSESGAFSIISSSGAPEAVGVYGSSAMTGGQVAPGSGAATLSSVTGGSAPMSTSKPANWTLGQTSKQYESGSGGAGTVSTGKGDRGGASYGTYQLASKTGALQKFLKSSIYGQQFQGLTPGTAAFNAKWKEVARNDPNFGEVQHQFIKQTHYDPQMARLKKRGIDLSGRGAAVQDAVWSTSVQFGGGTSLIRDALKGRDAASMSDAEIITAIQDYKIANNDRLFKRSDARNRAGTLKRAHAEKKSLLDLASQSPATTASATPDTAATHQAMPTDQQAAPQTAPIRAASEALSQLRERRAGKHVDVDHLDANMAANLSGFITEAEQTFGRKLKVQSAYRPPTAKEKAALGSSGSTQAGLGKSHLVASTYGSMHGRGEAVDLKFADMKSISDPVRDKPRPSGRGRIARRA